MPLNASMDLYFALTQNELAKNKKIKIENNYYAFVINNTGVDKCCRLGISHLRW